jgi:ATP-dependent RNA helicase RhlE
LITVTPKRNAIFTHKFKERNTIMFIEKLIKPLATAFLAAGYTEPTEFQSICMPKINAGNDIFGVAADESGKTTCIVLATINKLKEEFEDAPRTI